MMSYRRFSPPQPDYIGLESPVPQKSPLNGAKDGLYIGGIAQAHNLKVVGSNPTPAPNFLFVKPVTLAGCGFFCVQKYGFSSKKKGL